MVARSPPGATGGNKSLRSRDCPGRPGALGKGWSHHQDRSLPTFLYILAFLCPPLAVYLDIGAGDELRLNIILTILGWIPGILHALYILSIHPPH
jgi:uncharacterized membrane protein YqaE (UPF0057 family)